MRIGKYEGKLSGRREERDAEGRKTREAVKEKTWKKREAQTPLHAGEGAQVVPSFSSLSRDFVHAG